MSDWGRVSLYYDFEQNHKWEGRQRVRGLISKAYRDPGTVNMILHAYYGAMYIYSRIGNKYPDFRGENWENKLSGRRALNTAFDVLFDFDTIDLGYSSVEDVLTGKDMSDEQMKDNIFNCEGTDGFINMTLTGNPEDGYTLKYGYQYRWSDTVDNDNNKMVKDFREALSLDENATYRMRRPKVRNVVENALCDMEDIGIPMTDEEFMAFEDLGLAWVRKMRELRLKEEE